MCPLSRLVRKKKVEPYTAELMLLVFLSWNVWETCSGSDLSVLSAQYRYIWALESQGHRFQALLYIFCFPKEERKNEKGGIERRTEEKKTKQPKTETPACSLNGKVIF